MCRVSRHEVRSISESIWLEYMGKKRQRVGWTKTTENIHGGRNFVSHKKREINLKFNQVWWNKEKIILNNWKWELRIWNSIFLFRQRVKLIVVVAPPRVCCVAPHSLTHKISPLIAATNMNKKLEFYVPYTEERSKVHAWGVIERWNRPENEYLVEVQKLRMYSCVLEDSRNTWDIQ